MGWILVMYYMVDYLYIIPGSTILKYIILQYYTNSVVFSCLINISFVKKQFNFIFICIYIIYNNYSFLRPSWHRQLFSKRAIKAINVQHATMNPNFISKCWRLI